MWWWLIVAAIATTGDAPADEQLDVELDELDPFGRLPPPPARDAAPPPSSPAGPSSPPPAPSAPASSSSTSDEVEIPAGCRWTIVADGHRGSLCGEPGKWRAIVAGDDEGRKYTLPEHALSRLARRLVLASARNIEVHGAEFVAHVNRSGDGFRWTLQQAEQPEAKGVQRTLLDVMGEIWQRAGEP